jgi:hypothetical protein
MIGIPLPIIYDPVPNAEALRRLKKSAVKSGKGDPPSPEGNIFGYTPMFAGTHIQTCRSMAS